MRSDWGPLSRRLLLVDRFDKAVNQQVLLQTPYVAHHPHGCGYVRFDDDIMYPLETVVAVEGGDDSGSDGGDRQGANSSTTAIVPAGKPAIVQTEKATITYQPRD
ncbi:hypothetical protein VTG60DRAFT_1374 [Thermothelomyces hinnuleus]